MNIIKANLTFAKPLTPLNLNKVYFNVIHHIEADNATPENIHAWHLERGWIGAGYNAYIRKNGTIYSLRGDNEGAHCTGHNSDGYGIALEGNYNIDTAVPLPQYKSLIELCQYNKKRFPNYKSTVGHNTFTLTDCPGKLFNMQQVVTDVAKIIDFRTETEKIVDNLVKLGITTSRQHWINVIDGVEPVNISYLKTLLSRVKG